MWGMAVFFYFYQYIIRVATGNLREPLTSEFSLNASEYGWFSACWLTTYALLQIPVGVALDRIGPRWVLAFSAVLCSFGSLLMAAADDFTLLCVSRLLLGAGSAAGFIATFKVSSDWFGAKLLPILVGVVSGVGVLGASFAGAPLVMLQEKIGWRPIFIGLSVVSAALALIYVLIMRNKHIDDTKKVYRVGESLKHVFSRSQIWLLGMVGFLLYMPVSVLADLWGPSFIKSVYGYSNVNAAFATSFIFYGNALGSFTVGWVFSRFVTYRRFFLTFISLAAIFMALLIWGDFGSFFWLSVLLLFLGGMVGAENMVFPLGSRCVRRGDEAIAASVINLFVTIGAVFCQPLVGCVLDFAWEGSMENGHPIYSAGEYRSGLSVLFLSLLMGIIVALFLKGKTK